MVEKRLVLSAKHGMEISKAWIRKKSTLFWPTVPFIRKILRRCSGDHGRGGFYHGDDRLLETLTDPSYYGQIVVQTFPLIGNYGVIPSDFESKGPHLKGYIVREWCETPSNFRAEGTLDAFLKERNIVGLYDI